MPSQKTMPPGSCKENWLENVPAYQAPSITQPILAKTLRSNARMMRLRQRRPTTQPIATQHSTSIQTCDSTDALIRLTTIRRTFVSPISAFLREGRRVKGSHAFFFTGGPEAEQAEITRPSSPAHATAPLQFAHRGGVRQLDSTVYSFQR